MDPRFLAGKGENPWTVVMLYGGDKDAGTLRKLYGIARRTIEAKGLEANVLSVDTRERQKFYKRVSPHLLRKLQSKELAGFSTGYVPPPDTDATELGWILSGTPILAFDVAARSDLLPPRPDSILPIIREVASIYPVTYGYQYVIDKYYGPRFHAVGMFLVHAFRRDLPDLPEVEERRTAQWCNTFREAVPAGSLRDVFPMNLLSDVHRRRLVDGVPLFEWIGQDDSRGRLATVTPTLWAWHVPDDQCVELGNELEAAGLLA